MGTGVFRRRWRYAPKRVTRRRYYVTAPTPPGTISLAAPVAYQTHQRDATGRADVPTSGGYTGTPAALELDFAGRGYATAVAAPSGGAFAARAGRQAAGAGALTARFSNDHTINASVSPVLVGDVWAGYGQSNVTGRGTNNQAFTGASGYGSKLAAGNVPALLADPAGVDSNGTPAGSFWPPLGTLVANAGVPFQAVVRGAGGTGIAAFAQGTGPYNTLLAAVRAVTPSPRGVVWWQGETDAANGMSATTYYGYLVALAAALYADLGCYTFGVRLQACTDAAAAAGLPAVRAAQDRAAAECPYYVQLCDLSDLATDDGFHLKTDANLATAAARMFAGMQAAGHYVPSGGGARVLRSGFIGRATG